MLPVKIGYYGPADPNHPTGGSIWQGVRLAFEEANSKDGYHGRPFLLVQDWDENPWTGGAATVARMAFLDQVWAIIGSVDGVSTHLAEQVVAKALLPLIDPGSTDRTVNAAFVPWMFSVAPDDRSLMKAVVRHLPEARFVLVTSTGHDARMLEKEFLSLLDTSHKRPWRHLEFEHTGDIAKQVAELDTPVVVVLAGVRDSAVLVRQLRRLKPSLTIFGGPAMARAAFLTLADGAAEGVRVPMPAVSSERSRRFAARFQDRYTVAPDFAACHGYDAAELLLTAVQRAGLDRTRIRDTIKELSPWQGVSGEIRWDKLQRNSRQVTLGVMRNGWLEPVP